ncbi:Monooxygenase [Lachnellula willkommii]|uniref:Monooxygenase n=1 Tax=Lachnellula willkommii TaxID=215461 RepID=A0A559M1E3_9HELO|nr:Monooxygenase [Lachnellula willkommii]
MAFQTLRKETKEIYDQFYDILEKTDFSILTFLAFGAALQLLSLAYLPRRLSTSLPLLWLGYRLLRSIVGSRDVFRTSFTDVKLGKYTTNLPGPSDGVVVFVLGARLNHLFGKLSPGTTQLDVVFKDMWQAEKNRKAWGYIGRTATLADSSDSEGTTTVWISYWKNVKGLHDFAATAAHRLGQDRYTAGKYPYVGVMHELYHAPKGSYETIYGNFRPWGLGATKVIVGEEEGRLTFKDTLVPNQNGSNMYTRMGKKE